MVGVLLSCNPVAYVRSVAHTSYLFRTGDVNSDSIWVFNLVAEMLSPQPNRGEWLQRCRP